MRKIKTLKSKQAKDYLRKVFALMNVVMPNPKGYDIAKIEIYYKKKNSKQ